MALPLGSRVRRKEGRKRSGAKKSPVVPHQVDGGGIESVTPQAPARRSTSVRDALPENLARRLRAVPLLRRLFETRDGHIVVGQRPNAPLLAALALSALAAFVPGRLGLAAALAWAYWCILEIGWGVNPFRRILGALVLLAIPVAAWLRR